VATFFIWGMIGVQLGWSQQPSEDSDLAQYHRAVELIDKEKYGAAITILDDYLAANSPSYDRTPHYNRVAEAEFYRAFAHYNLLHSNAQSQFEAFISTYPAHPRVSESYFYIGSLYFMRGDYDEVLPRLKKIDAETLTRDQVTQARFMMGYCYYKEDRHREAMNMFRQIRNEDGQFGEMGSYYYALISYDNGNYGEALKGFQKVKPDNKFAKDVDVYKASCLLKLQRYDELDAMAKELETNGRGSNAQVWFILGNAAFEREEYSKVINYFSKFEASRGGILNREGQYRMGFSYYHEANYKEAQPRFQKCLQPEDALAQNAYYYLGQCFLQIDNYESARTAFMKAADMKFNPEIQEESLFLYAKASFKTRYFEEALTALQTLMADYPGSSHQEEASGLIGEILLYTSNYKEAIAYLEDEDGLRTRRSRAAYQGACYQYGLQLHREGVYDDAAGYFKKAFNQNIDPEVSLDSYFWYGESLFRTQSYGEAIKAYENFLRQPYAAKNENYPSAHYGIGWATLQEKNFDKASRSFEKFIGLADSKKNPEAYVDALLRAGDCEFALKNYNGALRYYKQVRDFNTMHVDYALYQIGLLYFRKDDFKRAANAHVTLAAKYRKSEYRDDALITAAETYLTWLNNWSDCAKYCRVLIRDHSDSPYVPAALTRLAISEERSGNKTKAVGYYKQVVYDHCRSTANVTVALSSLSNLLPGSEFDEVEAAFRERCPGGAGGSSEMEGLAIEVADSRFFEENYPSAITKYENYISDYPNGSETFHAHYYLGLCYEKQNEFDKALENFEYVYQTEYANSYTVKALKSAADIHFRQGNSLTAMELYTAMESKSDKLIDRLSAQFGKAEVHMANEDYDAAKAEYLAIYADQNTTSYSRTKARVKVAACDYFLGLEEEAYGIFSEIEQQESNVFAAESQYYLTRILFDRAEYDQSKNAAFYLKETYPGQNYWKAKAFLVLAEDYLALGDTFQAVQGTLESLAAQTAYPDVAEEAKQRIAEIRGMDEGLPEDNDMDGETENGEGF